MKDVAGLGVTCIGHASMDPSLQIKQYCTDVGSVGKQRRCACCGCIAGVCVESAEAFVSMLGMPTTTDTLLGSMQWLACAHMRTQV